MRLLGRLAIAGLAADRQIYRWAVDGNERPFVTVTIERELEESLALVRKMLAEGMLYKGRIKLCSAGTDDERAYAFRGVRFPGPVSFPELLKNMVVTAEQHRRSLLVQNGHHLQHRLVDLALSVFARTGKERMREYQDAPRHWRRKLLCEHVFGSSSLP